MEIGLDASLTWLLLAYSHVNHDPRDQVLLALVRPITVKFRSAQHPLTERLPFFVFLLGEVVYISTKKPDDRQRKSAASAGLSRD
jgi:hypothetical protein